MLQSRLEKQAFQVHNVVDEKFLRDFLQLQSRLEKQAFQEGGVKMLKTRYLRGLASCNPA